jgi:cell filamentation protein
MNKAKISIRFFDDREVRAVWDQENATSKTRNYWKYLKAKLKKEKSQVVSATTQLKFNSDFFLNNSAWCHKTDI